MDDSSKLKAQTLSWLNANKTLLLLVWAKETVATEFSIALDLCQSAVLNIYQGYTRNVKYMMACMQTLYLQQKILWSLHA